MKAQDPPSKPDKSPIWNAISGTVVYDPSDGIFDWSVILHIHYCDIKYKKFNDTMNAMTDNFFAFGAD